MASDLMTAMLMGQNQSPLMADPNTMALIPQMSLAQSMLQGSLSGAPAYPAQALGRLAQALVGGQMMGSIGQEAASAYDRSAQAMSKIYPAGTPIGDMLRSPDPYTKFQGVQMAGKAALINSENKPLEPGQTIVAPRTPATAGGSVASGSAEQAGRVEREKEGAKAGVEYGNLIQPPGAPAPAAPAGPTRHLPPPADMRRAPTAAQSAPPAPGAGAPAASPTPAPGATNPTPTPAQQGAWAPDGEMTGRFTGQSAATLPNGAIRTPQGTIIPSVSEQTLPQSPAEAKAAVESWQKTRDSWNGSMGPGYEAEQRLNTIAGAFKQFQTGAWATHKAEIAAALKSVGLPAPATWEPKDVQLALHENMVETMMQLKASSSRWTQMEFKSLSGNKEHPNLQPEANLQMLAEDIGTIRHARDMTTDFNLAQRNGWRDPNSFQAAWMRDNPLSKYVADTKAKIGPLQGMPGAGGQTGEGGSGGGIPVLNPGQRHDLGGGWTVTRER